MAWNCAPRTPIVSMIFVFRFAGVLTFVGSSLYPNRFWWIERHEWKSTISHRNNNASHSTSANSFILCGPTTICASVRTSFWPKYIWHIYSVYAIAEWQCVDRKICTSIWIRFVVTSEKKTCRGENRSLTFQWIRDASRPSAHHYGRNWKPKNNQMYDSDNEMQMASSSQITILPFLFSSMRPSRFRFSHSSFCHIMRLVVGRQVSIRQIYDVIFIVVAIVRWTPALEKNTEQKLFNVTLEESSPFGHCLFSRIGLGVRTRKRYWQRWAYSFQSIFWTLSDWRYWIKLIYQLIDQDKNMEPHIIGLNKNNQF